MKRLLLLLALILSPLGLAWSQTVPVSHAAIAHPVSKAGSVAFADAISPDEWLELRVARDAALKKNPDLVEAGKQLNLKFWNFQRKLDLAVLKMDPSVAPIVAQLESIPGPAQPSTPMPPPASPVSHPNVPAPRASANQ